MAKCLKCNAVIPDGQEYCSECLEKENKESYLDSLLNSVEPTDIEKQQNRFAGRAKKKQQGEEEKQAEAIAEPTTTEDAVSEIPQTEEASVDLNVDNLFGDTLLEETLSKDASKYDIMSVQGVSDTEFDRMFEEDMLTTGNTEELPDIGDLLSQEEWPEVSEAAVSEEFPDMANLSMPETSDQMEDALTEELPDMGDLSMPEAASMPEELSDVDALVAMGAEASEEDAASEGFPDLEAFTVSEELPESEDILAAESFTESEDSAKMEEGYAESEDSAEAEGEMDNDILDLINSINSSEFGEESEIPEQGAEDLFALDSAFDDEETVADREPENIEDIFADTLRAVDSLSDEEQEAQEEESGKKKKSKKKKEKAKNAKPGLFKRIFGNVKKERSEEEIAKLKEKVIADAEEEERAEEEKRLKAAQAKEEKKQKAAQDKAEAKQKKLENEKKKAEKKAEQERLKKDAKERKKQEIQNLIDEIDHDEGRINRVGASIIFVLFAVLAVAVIIGTNIYSYDVSIDNAQEDFSNQRYVEAYENVYGLDIKKEDEEFYLQVMTVMYTYKQLNSYQNFYALGQYPQALDSLLKGLQRYDKYSALASVIGIESDMDYVRDEIIEELEEVFELSELEAVRLSAIQDQEEYTQKVFEIAQVAEN